MAWGHDQEKEQLKKLFLQEKIDRFEERFAVYEAFLQTERHVTIEELLELIRDMGHDLDRFIVEDTMNLMCHFGFARKGRFERGRIRYEHRHLGQHHDHLICTKCRKIMEFEDQRIEELQLEIAHRHGFHLLQHKMELYGLCRTCQSERKSLIPLSAAKSGESVVVRDISAGTRASMRLLSMGIRVGDRLEVLTNLNRGQLVVAAGFSRIVLGRSLAEKIKVETVGAN